MYISRLDTNTTLENSRDDLTRGNKKRPTLTCKGILQTFIVASLMLISIALLSIPIIFYYIESPGSSVKTNIKLNLPNHLVNLQTCEGAMDIDILNLNATKSQMLSTYHNLSIIIQDNTSFVLDTLTVLHNISSQLGNAPCINMIPSLLVMDHYNISTKCIAHQQCGLIRDTFCAVEWRLAENVFNFDEPFFKCCDNNEPLLPESTPVLNCTDQFVLICNSLCFASCETFSQYSESITNVFDTFFKAVSSSLYIGATIVLILSIVKRKTMFTFPQIYSVFGNICLFVTGLSLAVPHYLGRGKAFCSDDTLVFSLLNPTTTCQITGFSVYAGLTIYAEFWFLHLVHTLLKLAYPFLAQKFENCHYFKVIYAAEVIIPIVLGCVPFAIISSMSRFNMVQFPANSCYPDNVTIIFYAFTLPVILIQMAGTAATIMLVVVLYNHMQKSQLHKSSVLKFSLCSKSHQLYVSTPVVKILILFLSYTTVLVLNWILFTDIVLNTAKIIQAVEDYSVCLAIGYNPLTNAICNEQRESLEALSNPRLIISANVMLGLLPYFSITYIIRIRNIVKYVMNLFHKHDKLKKQATQISLQ